MSERKKVAIVGTAETWNLAPFADPTWDIWSLNDAYRQQDGRRVSAWFDLHPIHLMHFVSDQQTRVDGFEVPLGHYVRPAGYLQWLATRQFPIYLADAHPQIPTSVRYPKDEALALCGPYFASGPSWMLALAALQGYEEVGIFGIHLSTQQEYIEQRPQFEYQIGYLRGKLGMHIWVPDDCPLLKHEHLYAYEPRPRLALEAIERTLARVRATQDRYLKEAKTAKRKPDPAKLEEFAIQMADLKHQGQLAAWRLKKWAA